MIDADMGVFLITLRATGPLYFSRHMGQAAKQFSLAVVGRANPPLADLLDVNDNQPKPLTAHGPFCPCTVEPLQGHIEPGQQAWIRLAGLRREVVAALAAFEANPPDTQEFDHLTWEVGPVTCVAETTYASLLASHQHTPPPQVIELRFGTPTAFSVKGNTLPLPLPEQMFDGLAERWGAFSEGALPRGFALPEELPTFVEYYVAVRAHRIRTHALPFHKQGRDPHPEIGFTGEVTLEIQRRNRQLGKYQADDAHRIEARLDELARAVGMLTDFGYYSGVGKKTTQGMGMVERVR